MYIYVFEDGTVQQHKSQPTQSDKDAIADGLLQVLRCSGNGVKNVDSDGTLEDLQSCKVESVDCGEWHVPS